MYFSFALNLYMTLSSADKPFKQFGPRSGPIFCPDLIGVQTVWHFRGYDKLELNRCILTLRKPLQGLWQQMTSADNCFKQFGPRSGPTFCPDLILVHTVWHFRGYDKLKLNRCILTLRWTLTWHCHLLITLSNTLDPDQARHSVQTW